VEYRGHLTAFLSGLRDAGWLSNFEMPAFPADSDIAPIWRFLSSTEISSYIEFVPDAFWSTDWTPENRQQVRSQVLEHLRSRDIDLLIAMGTWAGQDTAVKSHSIPVLVLSTSDPVAAGIIVSPQDSGLDHVYATCDPDRFVRQLRMFYRLTGFRKLGVLYIDSPEGRVWSNIADLEKVSAEFGFELVTIPTVEAGLSLEQCRDDVRARYTELSTKVDAVWLTTLRGEDPQFFPYVIEPLIRMKIPTWSQVAEAQVRRGSLFGVPDASQKELGEHLASVVSSIFHGKKPREIPQIFEPRSEILINMETARRIGYEVHDSLKVVAKQLFQTIEGERK
jgi:ABC-type uncharacterized transport system substrate-binding protein